MNEKDDKKKEAAKKSKTTNRGRKKKEGWFARNKTLFTLSIETLIVIIIILLAFWYFSYKVAHLNDSVSKSNQEIEMLTNKLDSLLVLQNQLRQQTAEMHETIMSEFDGGESGTETPGSDEPSTEAVPQTDTVDADEDSSLFLAWETWLVIALIIVVILLAYFALRKNKKKEVEDAF
ncbi:hypothetical protein GF337_03905 [candidate division KSB1 bacterium]|nr:hypothetical protein [candidate division KSB1 bacterium]